MAQPGGEGLVGGPMTGPGLGGPLGPGQGPGGMLGLGQGPLPPGQGLQGPAGQGMIYPPFQFPSQPINRDQVNPCVVEVIAACFGIDNSKIRIILS